MTILPIVFTLSMDNNFIVQLTAEVELPGLLPHYQVRNIHLADNRHPSPTLSDITIKCIVYKESRVWVHTDSQMPSGLSMAVGAAIESGLPAIELAAATDPLTEDDMPPA